MCCAMASHDYTPLSDRDAQDVLDPSIAHNMGKARSQLFLLVKKNFLLQVFMGELIFKRIQHVVE